MKSTRIFDDEGVETGVQLVAEQIEAIRVAMKKLEQTRATKKLIVALIHDDTKLGKNQIELVLESLETMDQKYLKPRKVKSNEFQNRNR